MRSNTPKRRTGGAGAAAALGASVVMGAALFLPAVGEGQAAAATTSTSTTTTTTIPGSDCTSAVNGGPLSRSGWSAATNAPASAANAPANALDGNLLTRFSSQEDQAPGLLFQLDLGSSQTFDQVSMAAPNSPSDYARAFVVEVSNDAANWTTVASCTSTSDNQVISFKPQTARYVRIVLTAKAGYWWSIDEINLYNSSDCSASVTQNALDRTGWSATTNAPYNSSDPASAALDGKMSTRFSTNRDQASGLYYQVDLGSKQSFDQLSLATPNSPNDYPRSFQVQLSNDGHSWWTVASCKGAGAFDVVSFPTQEAQFVRVTLNASASYWWSIDELNLYTSGVVVHPTTTTTAPPATTVKLAASGTTVVVGDQVTYTATVSPVPKGGTVTFVSDGTPIANCSAIAVNTSNGQASCTTTYQSTGQQDVKAFYSGYSSERASQSAYVAESITAPAAGYWLATANGQVYGFGAAQAMGSATTTATTGPIVGIASSPDAKGYWTVTSNGTVSNFGNAPFFGDLPDMGKHVHDIVAIAPTTDGKGYYLVGADGGFFTFGDARFHGSVPGLHIHVGDVVGMVSTPGGSGYILVGGDGGVFTFGRSRFYGSLPGIGRHVHDIKAILPSTTGKGYVLVGADGGAFVFGTGAHFLGSLPGEGIHVNNVVGLALTPNDGGYYMASSDGHVYAFGNAQAGPEPSGLSQNLPVTAIAGT